MTCSKLNFTFTLLGLLYNCQVFINTNRASCSYKRRPHAELQADRSVRSYRNLLIAVNLTHLCTPVSNTVSRHHTAGSGAASMRRLEEMRAYECHT